MLCDKNLSQNIAIDVMGWLSGVGLRPASWEF